jgi:beta-glucosidase
VAAAVAAEARAAGNDRGFSPELQVVTDPRFGRGQENFGADPLFVSEMGVAALKGLQGSSTGGPDEWVFVSFSIFYFVVFFTAYVS